jgi:aspartyl-tRNA(Asn)/glutamyl-tRNA(Gln) amidotransferase subunit B
MEEGSLRCDANVSVRPMGETALGTKIEIKNVNSFRYIRHALEYEIERQKQVLASGSRLEQETRLYDPGTGKTYSMRSKEGAHDYRYFPEPDLPALVVDPKWQAEIESHIPELPQARRHRLRTEYGISEQDAYTLTVNRNRADQFEIAARKARNPKRVASLIGSELLGRLKARDLELEQSPISMDGLVLSADLAEAGTISSKMLKALYDKCFDRGEDFPAVYERDKPQQISDTAALEGIIDEVIAASPKQVEQYRAGRTNVLAYFVGQVMKASKGQANPERVNELLPKKLRPK